MQLLGDPKLEGFRLRTRRWLQESIPAVWKNPRSREALTEEELRELGSEWNRALFRGGFAGLTWPVKYGGQGLGPLEEFIFYEEAAAAHAPEGLDLIGRFLAGPAIIAAGTPEQQSRYLAPILRGDEVWCEGLSEPNAGSDLAAVTTTAYKRNGQYVIQGRKIWTSNAHVADFCYLLARTLPDAPRHHNLGVIIVDMHQQGINVSPIKQINELSEFNEVEFDGATAPIENLIGAEDQGWQLSNVAGFRRERGTFDAARRYVYLRDSFDQLVFCNEENAGDQGTAIDALRDRLEVLRWHLRRVTELRANDRPTTKPSSVLKLTWSELWQDITELGVSIHCAEHLTTWRRLYLESRAATIYGGTVEIQRNVIANQVLKLPR